MCVSVFKVLVEAEPVWLLARDFIRHVNWGAVELELLPRGARLAGTAPYSQVQLAARVSLFPVLSLPLLACRLQGAIRDSKRFVFVLGLCIQPYNFWTVFLFSHFLYNMSILRILNRLTCVFCAGIDHVSWHFRAIRTQPLLSFPVKAWPSGYHKLALPAVGACASHSFWKEDCIIIIMNRSVILVTDWSDKLEHKS